MRRFAAPLMGLVVLGLSGCGNGGLALPSLFGSGNAVTLTGNPLTDFAPMTQKLAAYTETDVKLALADAQAQTPPDAVGMSCWSTILQALPLVQTSAGAAGAVAIQKGRDLQHTIPLVANACSGLIPFF